jgi:hypothetical protein
MLNTKISNVQGKPTSERWQGGDNIPDGAIESANDGNAIWVSANEGEDIIKTANE